MCSDLERQKKRNKQYCKFLAIWKLFSEITAKREPLQVSGSALLQYCIPLSTDSLSILTPLTQAIPETPPGRAD